MSARWDQLMSSHVSVNYSLPCVLDYSLQVMLKSKPDCILDVSNCRCIDSDDRNSALIARSCLRGIEWSTDRSYVVVGLPYL